MPWGCYRRFLKSWMVWSKTCLEVLKFFDSCPEGFKIVLHPHGSEISRGRKIIYLRHLVNSRIFFYNCPCQWHCSIHKWCHYRHVWSNILFWSIKGPDLKMIKYYQSKKQIHCQSFVWHRESRLDASYYWKMVYSWFKSCQFCPQVNFPKVNILKFNINFLYNPRPKSRSRVNEQKFRLSIAEDASRTRKQSEADLTFLFIPNLPVW